MKIVLNAWRQSGPNDAGRFVRYELSDVSPDMSFLEMLDLLNESLLHQGQEPLAFDNDCREGICGMCGFFINGEAHGPQPASTVCQLYMRSFKDGDELRIEPWRVKGFPVVKDLCVNRGAFDRIIASGGYITAATGSAPEANTTRIPKRDVDRAMDAASCIGCGACAAACPNGSAMLFTGAKVTHLSQLPQGQPEIHSHVRSMVAQHDAEGFGSCTNIGECAAVCPAEIPIDVISQLNRTFVKSLVAAQPESRKPEGE